MKKTILALIIIFSVSAFQAQETDSAYKYWLTAGGMLTPDVVSFNFDYSFSSENYFYKIGYLISGGFGFTSAPNIGDNGYLYKSIDFSIGKRLLSKWFQVAFFTGPSYLFGKKRTLNQDIIKYNTFGLQTDVQLLFRIANEIGLGIGLYGNVNFEKSFTGINLNITLGNGR